MSFLDLSLRISLTTVRFSHGYSMIKNTMKIPHSTQSRPQYLIPLCSSFIKSIRKIEHLYTYVPIKWDLMLENTEQWSSTYFTCFHTDMDQHSCSVKLLNFIHKWHSRRNIFYELIIIYTILEHCLSYPSMPSLEGLWNTFHYEFTAKDNVSKE